LDHNIGVCILTRTPITVLTTRKNYYRKKKKGTVVWPAMIFGGFKLQPEKITSRNKGMVQSAGHQLETGKNYVRKKRYSRLVVGWSTKYKTQRTSYTKQQTR
jgi:hypothetical protein